MNVHNTVVHAMLFVCTVCKYFVEILQKKRVSVMRDIIHTLLLFVSEVKF